MCIRDRGIGFKVVVVADGLHSLLVVVHQQRNIDCRRRVFQHIHRCGSHDHLQSRRPDNRRSQAGFHLAGIYAMLVSHIVSSLPVSYTHLKVEKGEAMEATITLELTYIMIEVDGVQLLEVDKLNGIYKVNGNDMLAGVNSLV